MPETAPFGLLNINKPLHLTSHDVVGRVRRVFGLRRVGHAGTLDPLATGVLVVCVGQATRLSEYAMAATKTYRAIVQLGQSTTTYDAEGDFTEQHDASHITQAAIEAVLPQFTGAISQLPPIYSAVKRNGKKLYELAREGKSIEREPRHVRIDAITLTEYDPIACQAHLDITCGSGTYIRSLAYDIGQALQVGGHLAGLVRTRSGTFHVENATSLDKLDQADNPQQHLISVAEALKAYPSITLYGEELNHIRHGRRIDGANNTADGTIAMSYAPDGQFIAVLQAVDGRWKPHKVFSSAS